MNHIKMKQKKIHISAAGSGGHIVPAIEIANQLVLKTLIIFKSDMESN